MRIGIDAYPLFSKENTGIGNVVLSVIEELAKHDKKNEYILYTPGITHHDRVNEIIKNKNFSVSSIKGLFPHSRRLWLQSPQLTQTIKKDALDIFWGGGEYIPIRIPRSTVVITTIHDVVFKLFPETVSRANMLFYTLLLPFCLRRADRCITVSENSKEDIEKLLHFNAHNIDVIYNAIDTSSYKKSTGSKIKKKHLLFVGTLQPRKNLVNVLKAYSQIADTIDVPLVIIGASGWKSSAMKDFIEKIPPHIRKKIIFKGYIERKALKEYYQNAIALICPSLHEGFGLCIGEAMAAGTAVISSKRGAIPEIFSDAALYVNPESPSDIAHAILLLAHNESTRRAFEKKGLARVKIFDIKHLAKRYIECFRHAHTAKA